MKITAENIIEGDRLISPLGLIDEVALVAHQPHREIVVMWFTDGGREEMAYTDAVSVV